MEHPGAPLLADTELGENLAQQIVGREFTSDRAQSLMGQSELFSIQLQVPRLYSRLRKMPLRGM